MSEFSWLRASGFLVLLVLAIYVTFDALIKMYKAMRKGTHDPKYWGNWGARVKLLLINVFGQKKLLRHPAGYGHLVIFYGFILATIVSMEVFIRAFFVNFSYSFLGPVYKGILLFEDFFSTFVFIAVLIGLFRRYVQKPLRFKDDQVMSKGLNRDATIILLVVGIHMIFGVLLESLEIALNNHPLGDEAANWSIISGWVSTIWSGELAVVEGIVWWIHAASVWVFMIYIFGTNVRVPKFYPSKHAHILASVLNVFFGRLHSHGALSTMDFEDENLEIYGNNDIETLTWPQMMDLYSCTGCGRCQEVCPSYLSGQLLSPKALILNMRDQLLEAVTIRASDTEKELEPIFGASIPSETLWSCTTCLACTTACPVMIEHVDKIIDVRRYQAMMEAEFPPGLGAVMNNLETQSNPWGIAKNDRDKWAIELDIKQFKDHPDTPLLFWVGCAGSFDERAKKVATDLVKILRSADVDFAILGKEEGCTGDIARRAGNEYLAVEMMQSNVEVLNSYNFKDVITLCPHCFNNLKNELPDFGGEYNVFHAVDYVAKLILDKKLKLNHEADLNITYHDSCYLGRYNDIYDAPRTILKQFKGVNFVEMEMSKDMAICCGGGGAKAFFEIESELEGAKDINKTRIEMAVKTDSQVIGVSCPFCTIMLEDGIKNMDAKLEVQDLIEIVSKNLIE